MKSIPMAVVALFALAAVPLVAEATPITYRTILSGAAENPPNASAGTGIALVTLDTAADTLKIDLTFSGLTGVTTVAHVHCCIAAPGNVGVATQTPSFAGFPLGVMMGVYTATFDTTLASTWRAGFITANGGTPAGAEAAFAAGLASGQAYFNLHSSVFTAGELRGFLVAVPAPGAVALFGLGLAGLAGVARRRAAIA